MDRRLERALLGLCGGVAGLLAKRAAAAAYNRLIPPRTDHRPKRSWSVVGDRHLPNESSNDALARLLYTTLAGHPPSERTKQRLGVAVDWGFGAVMGALYALTRGTQKDLDVRGGLTLAIALWVLVDEIGLALIGMQDAPTSYPPRTHARALVSHLAYGLAVSATTQKLARGLGLDC